MDHAAATCPKSQGIWYLWGRACLQWLTRTTCLWLPFLLSPGVVHLVEMRMYGEVPFLPMVPQRFRSPGGGGLGRLLIPDVRPVPFPSDECGDVHTHSAERAAYSAPAKRRGKKTQGARGVVHGTNPIAPQGRAHGHTSGAAPSDLLSAQRLDAGAAPGIGKDDAGYGVDATPGACMVPRPGAGLLPHGIIVAPGVLADQGLSEEHAASGCTVDLCAAPLIAPAPVHPACMVFTVVVRP